MIKSKDMQLILASASQTRKKILESLGLDFKVIPSHIDEFKISASNPKLLVQKIARVKAETVNEKLKEVLTQGAIVCRVDTSFSPPPPLFCHHLILAADSMVVIDNHIIGKPKDKKDAKTILKRLSGRTHSFITGLYLINTKTNKSWQKIAETKVTFRKLKDREIDDYINKTDVTRFAGAYATIPPNDFNLKTVKNNKSDIIKKISGSLTNIMGLPLEILLPILKENGLINDF